MSFLSGNKDKPKFDMLLYANAKYSYIELYFKDIKSLQRYPPNTNVIGFKPHETKRCVICYHRRRSGDEWEKGPSQFGFSTVFNKN